MSQTETPVDGSSDESTLKPSDSVAELKHIGKRRSHRLPFDTIEELSRTTADELYSGSDIAVPKDIAENIMSQAQEVVDEADESSETNTEEVDADESEELLDASELDPDAEPTSERPQMADCEHVGIIVGMQTESANRSALADADPDEVVQQFVKELTACGLDPSGDGWKPVILDTGMGRPEVIRYLKEAENHSDVIQKSANLGAHSQARDAYRERDEAFIDRIDGLFVAENGEYVGKFVNMANEAGLAIHSPPMDDVDTDGLNVVEE